MKIFIGTLKGLFRIIQREGEWVIEPPEFAGQMVYAVTKGRERIWAAPFTEWTGTQMSYSDDGGNSWEAISPPLAFPGDTETALSKVWQITVGPDGRMFCGVQPAALFTSEDNGKSWELCRGLWDHPHREKWEPGYGGLGLHTILPLTDSLWVVAVSTGGVYRTEDAGVSWTACNQSIIAPFLPEKKPEFGQCVHKIALNYDKPDQMFLQHHWGVYLSENLGKSWENIAENKLPSDFGFGVAVTRNSSFVIPIKADSERVFPEGKMRVYRTRDKGDTWEPLTHGLPQKDVYDCVLRDSFHSMGENLAFGTTGGHVYFSSDDGDHWEEIAGHLPRISCVRVFE